MEEPTITDTQAERRLVVELALEKAIGILSLDDNLVNRMIVQAHGELLSAPAGIVHYTALGFQHRVIVVIASKDVEFLTRLTCLSGLRQHIISGFYTCC